MGLRELNQKIRARLNRIPPAQHMLMLVPAALANGIVYVGSGDGRICAYTP